MQDKWTFKLQCIFLVLFIQCAGRVDYDNFRVLIIHVALIEL